MLHWRVESAGLCWTAGRDVSRNTCAWRRPTLDGSWKAGNRGHGWDQRLKQRKQEWPGAYGGLHSQVVTVTPQCRQ